MSFPAVMQNAAYYTAQESSSKGLDPFAVVGLDAESTSLTQDKVRLHVKHAVKHVYERQGMFKEGTEHVSRAACGATAGPRVPTWAQFNMHSPKCLQRGAAHAVIARDRGVVPQTDLKQELSSQLLRTQGGCEAAHESSDGQHPRLRSL